MDNINDDVGGYVSVILKRQRLCIISLLLRANDTLSLAIRDLETFYYSPLRGNILGRTFLCVGARALYRALDRPEGRASLSDFLAGTGEIVSEQVCHNFVGTVYKHL